MIINNIDTKNLLNRITKPEDTKHPLDMSVNHYFQKAFTTNPSASTADIARAIVSIRNLAFSQQDKDEITESLTNNPEVKKEVTEIIAAQSEYEISLERQEQHKSLVLCAQLIDRLIENRKCFSDNDLKRPFDATIENLYMTFSADIIDFNSDSFSVEDLVDKIRREVSENRKGLSHETEKEYFAWLLGSLGRFSWGFKGNDNAFESGAPNTILEVLSNGRNIDYALCAEVRKIAEKNGVTPYTDKSF